MLQVKPLSLQEKERLKQLSQQQQRELEAKKARKQDFQAGRGSDKQPLLTSGGCREAFAQRQNGLNTSQSCCCPWPFQEHHPALAWLWWLLAPPRPKAGKPERMVKKLLFLPLKGVLPFVIFLSGAIYSHQLAQQYMKPYFKMKGIVSPLEQVEA